MPIGSAKIGVLGAGLVPGGTTTFNASGTFTVPPGVKKVNITGKGGTGNPGNAGNAGNPGNPGTGGAGGAGGSGYGPRPAVARQGTGGWALKDFFCTNYISYPAPSAFWNCAVSNGKASTCLFGPQAPKMTAGGANGCGISPSGNAPPVQTSAQSGATGNAGSAGNAGNPGNTGGTSSGLCKNFTGGAGGNAGVAGAAGNGGSGGTGGGRGNCWQQGTSPASGGNGGGAGGSGGSFPSGNNQKVILGAGGGGGAGTNTDGSSGQTSTSSPKPAPGPALTGSARGGDGCVSSPASPVNQTAFFYATPGPAPASMVGGAGGQRFGATDSNCFGFMAGSSGSNVGLKAFESPRCGFRQSINTWNPAPLFPTILRAGAGGGAVGSYDFGCNSSSYQVGSGGGGGGRGNAGNAGGTSPTPSGSAATPSTFNCVSVTPGAPYPITVASPGGQIVISWNPQ